MTKLLLIRHALTEAVGKRLTGRFPGVHLNQEGRAQALQLAEQLRNVPISAIYCSPMERAVETAAPIAKLHDLEYVVCDSFQEIDFGEWTNLTFDELAEDPRFHHFNTFRSCTRIPGGELMLEAQTRVMHGIQNLYAKHQHEVIAVVSHADLIKAAIAYYSGVHLDLFQRFEISPASVSVVELFEETVRIIQVNNKGEI